MPDRDMCFLQAWTPFPTMSRLWGRCATGTGGLRAWAREGSGSPAPSSTDATPVTSSMWRSAFVSPGLRMFLLYLIEAFLPPSVLQVSVLHHSAPADQVNHMAANPQYMRPVHHPLMIHTFNSHMSGKANASNVTRFSLILQIYAAITKKIGEV